MVFINYYFCNNSNIFCNNNISRIYYELSIQILFSYYYNSHTRDVNLYVHSKLLQIYYDYYGFAHNSKLTDTEYQDVLQCL